MHITCSYSLFTYVLVLFILNNLQTFSLWGGSILTFLIFTIQILVFYVYWNAIMQGKNYSNNSKLQWVWPLILLLNNANILNVENDN